MAGDFNAKSMTWDSRRTEPRGTYLLDILTRNELMPIRTTGIYSSIREGNEKCLNVLDVNRRMTQNSKNCYGQVLCF